MTQKIKLPLLAVFITLILLFSAAGMYSANRTDSRTVMTKDTAKQLRDGMYLVSSTIKNETDTPDIIGPNKFVVKCSDMLIENNEGEYIKMIIDTTGFVPLILRVNPKTEQQTETKKRIEIELTKSAADKLERFTTVNLNKRIALIIDGEVISAHGIKTPITGGRFQISYCGPDMCEILESKLINDVESAEMK